MKFVDYCVDDIRRANPQERRGTDRASRRRCRAPDAPREPATTAMLYICIARATASRQPCQRDAMQAPAGV